MIRRKVFDSYFPRGHALKRIAFEKKSCRKVTREKRSCTKQKCYKRFANPVHDPSVIPVLAYGTETSTKTSGNKFRVAQRAMELRVETA